MVGLDRKSETPLYQQLAYNIKKDISQKIYKENDKLPSENELSRTLNLSRTIVRMAMEILEKEGYIYKLRGKGSFVSSPKIYQDRSSFAKFNDIKSLGKKLSSKILYQKVKKPNDYIREQMQLSDEDLVFKLIWIRSADDEPLIYETIYLNYSIVKGIEELDLTTNILYDILSCYFGITKVSGKELFYPCKLSSSEADSLMVKENDLGMKVNRIIFYENNVLEFTDSIVRGDKFIYTTHFNGNLKLNK